MDPLGGRGPPTEIPDVASLDLSYDEITDGEAIGRGGNADVFRVTVERGGREITVVVKQPRLQGTLDTDTVDQFVQEADVWAELDGHEHIVSLHDWGAEPLPWLAMEYMDRGTLADVPDGERLPLEQALWIGVCVCNAVNYAHRYGVAHHDIKPANVLLASAPDSWAVPKVSDWGLARLMIEETGSVDGLSPQYAAPEQFDAERYGSPDDRTDIYQVGTLLYELVTGHPPFEGSTTAVMQDVLSTEPRFPSEVADVPTEFDEALRPALEKDPDDRYESILYLRDALQDLFDEYRGDTSTEGDRTSPGVAPGGSGSAADDSARVDDSSADRHGSAVEGREEEPAERNPERSTEAESGTAESETVDADDAESRVAEFETRGSDHRPPPEGGTPGAREPRDTDPGKSEQTSASGKQSSGTLPDISGGLALGAIVGVGVLVVLAVMVGGLPGGGDSGTPSGEAQFEVTAVEAPDEVTAGEEFDVTVSVQNTGETAGNGALELDAGELGNESESVEELESGAGSVPNEFRFETDESDAGMQYDITATIGNATSNATVSVVPEPAQAELGGLDIAGQDDAAQFFVSEGGSVSVNVTNDGGQAGSFDIDLEVGDKSPEKTTGELGPDGTETVRFDGVLDDLSYDEYDVTVSAGNESVSGTLVVLAEFGVSIESDGAPAGEILGIELVLEDEGSSDPPISVELNVIDLNSDEELYDRTVELPSEGEPELVDIPTNSDDAGDYRIEVTPVGLDQVIAETELTIGGQSGEPNFEVTAVEAPDEGTAGDEFDVTVTVENTGSSASREITVDAGALGSETRELSLLAGESTDAMFTFDTSGSGAGTYEITASGDTEGTATVTVSEPASLSGLDIEGEGADATIPRGEDATVEVQLTNDGEQSKAFEAALSVDGSRQQTASTGTLEPGETGTASFELSGDREPGTYGITVSVTGQAVTGTVEIAGTAVSSLSGLDIAEDGTEATITQTAERGVAVTVENRGGLADNFGVSLKIGDGLVERDETFTDDLTPGASETITFDAVTGSLDPGEYDVTVNTSDDTTTGTLTVEQPSREFFSVSSLSVQQKRATGESIEPTAEIENVGTESGTQSVTLTVYLQGEVQQTDRAENITLAGGASTTVEFSSFEVSRGGNYGIFVETANDTAQQNIQVSEEQAFFDVTILSASSQVAEGGEISVTALIENTGGGTDSQTVEVTTNPSIGSDQTTVKLDADESTTEEFTIETSDNDAGDYDITLSSEDDTDSERVTVTSGGFLDVSIQVTNSPTVGNDIEVTARITNTGGGTASQTVEATTSIGSDQTTVELAADASTTKTFSIGTEDGDSGEYTVTVSSDDSSASGTVTVVGVFTVEITNIESPVSAGDPVAVQVDVSNTGTVETTKTVTLDVGALGSTLKDVELAGSESKFPRLKLSTEVDDVGNYTATVSTEKSSDSERVTVEPSALSAPSTAGRSADAMRLRDTGTDAPGWSSARATDAPKTLEPIAGAYGW